MSQQHVQIASVSDLLAALDDPRALVRMATLRAIAEHPGKASALASEGEIDLFDALAERRDRPSEMGMRASYVNAMLRLDDERVPAMARAELLATEESEVVILCASALAELPAEERRDFLSPIVMAAIAPNKMRVAANLLAHCRDLPIEVAIRVAVVTDHDVALPPVNDETLAPWLEELQGPYARRARARFVAPEGKEAFAALVARWERLPVGLRPWALRAAVQQHPTRHGWLVRDALRRDDDPEVLLTALAAWREIPPSEGDEALLEPLAHHEDAALRAAAVSAGAPCRDWVARLRQETDDRARAALIARIGRQGAPHLPLLAECLRDDSWRIRAAATAALVDAAPASIPLLQRLFSDPTPTVHTAAAQALRRLDQTPWMVTALSSGCAKSER